jgi:L-aspartate oxidase
MRDKFLETELLIIGSGISGLTAAILGAQYGFKIVIINRSPSLEESNTWYAQGGIVYRGQNDSAKILARDIYLVGDRIGNIENINILAKEGPKIVKNFLIEKLKIPFSKDTGKLHFSLEGGHSKKRIIHVADETGKFIEKFLLKELKKYPNVKILTNHTAIDLITPSHHSPQTRFIYRPLEVIGAYVLDNNLRKVKTILAQRTILATGGAAWLFLYTTNPEGARGDGIAMASRAGARIVNLEFIQFHPTCFCQKDAPCFLISEAVRGEGAILLNEFGKPFMKKYSSQKELAPRDEICRAMYREMIERKVENFFLDLSPIKKSGLCLKERFPFIYQQCLKYGIDIEKDLIPVIPAAHYTCGGIWVNSEGKTTIENLYAIGEVACTGIHGANRLASTSLLEGLVWGKRCIENIKRQKKYEDLKKFQIPTWFDTGIETPDDVLLRQDWLTIRTTMWNYLGVARSQKRLERAKEDLIYLENRIEKFYKETKITDNLIGLRNGVRVARMVAQSVFQNKKSRGCHYRLD